MKSNAWRLNVEGHSPFFGLPPGLGADLELSTGSGDIECDVPVVLLGHGRQHMNAKYGRGGAAVKAQTVSGDLHVTSGGR